MAVFTFNWRKINIILLQVLVYHDLLGMLQHPHHAKVTSPLFSSSQIFCVDYKEICLAVSPVNLAGILEGCAYSLSVLPQVTPKFCKQFGHVGDVINKALSEYKHDVENKSFPGASHTPYRISAADVDGFMKELQTMGLTEAASAAGSAAEKFESNGSPDS